MPLTSVAWQYMVSRDEISLVTDRTATPRRRRYRKAGLGNAALQRCLDDIAAIMREDFRRAFAEAGPGWQPLKPSTIRAKIRLGMPPKNKRGQVFRRLRQVGASGADSILIRSGDLRDSYGTKNHPGHVEEVDIESETVAVGSAMHYAGVHQTGAVIGRRRSPVVPPSRQAQVVRQVARARFAIRAGKLRITGMGGILPARPVTLSRDAKEKIRVRVALYMREVAAED